MNIAESLSQLFNFVTLNITSLFSKFKFAIQHKTAEAFVAWSHSLDARPQIKNEVLLPKTLRMACATYWKLCLHLIVIITDVYLTLDTYCHPRYFTPLTQNVICYTKTRLLTFLYFETILYESQNHILPQHYRYAFCLLSQNTQVNVRTSLFERYGVL
ncbi:hypothetical protein EGR_07165 [Echinococcus granulosus]|uniref:Uncharacterized protein n=1 Tax=Echinococcus granulosus TaxID=6210 RepID=W6U9D3_ECHGR|nr:hypothetical protein EGR_07165 [Echinococcus granulosus]EUB57973.1 hypothetical protein EGR_07165 [Echinococcus granulosus]